MAPVVALKYDCGYAASGYYEMDEMPRLMQTRRDRIRNRRYRVRSTFDARMESLIENVQVARSIPYMPVYLQNQSFIGVDFVRFREVLEAVERGMECFHARNRSLTSVPADECILRFYERDGIKVFFNLFFDGDEDNIAQVNVSINGKFYSCDGTVERALDFFYKVMEKEEDGRVS